MSTISNSQHNRNIRTNLLIRLDVSKQMHINYLVRLICFWQPLTSIPNIVVVCNLFFFLQNVFVIMINNFLVFLQWHSNCDNEICKEMTSRTWHHSPTTVQKFSSMIDWIETRSQITLISLMLIFTRRKTFNLFVQIRTLLDDRHRS